MMTIFAADSSGTSALKPEYGRALNISTARHKKTRDLRPLFQEYRTLTVYLVSTAQSHPKRPTREQKPQRLRHSSLTRSWPRLTCRWATRSCGSIGIGQVLKPSSSEQSS